MHFQAEQERISVGNRFISDRLKSRTVVCLGEKVDRLDLTSGFEIGLRNFRCCLSVEFFLDLRREDAADRWHIAISREKSRLHGHGYATLFLAECYGTASGWDRSQELGVAVARGQRDGEHDFPVQESDGLHGIVQ